MLRTNTYCRCAVLKFCFWCAPSNISTPEKEKKSVSEALVRQGSKARKHPGGKSVSEALVRQGPKARKHPGRGTGARIGDAQCPPAQILQGLNFRVLFACLSPPQSAFKWKHSPVSVTTTLARCGQGAAPEEDRAFWRSTLWKKDAAQKPNPKARHATQTVTTNAGIARSSRVNREKAT